MVVVNGLKWLPMAADGDKWPFVVMGTSGYLWSLVTASRGLW